MRSNHIFVYGPPQVDKVSIIQKLLEYTNIRFITINCIEAYSQRIVYEKILNDICNYNSCDDLESQVYVTCTQFESFVNKLIMVLNNLTIEDENKSTKIILLFDHIDRINKNIFGDGFVDQLFKLNEMTGHNICIIMTSNYFTTKNVFQSKKPLIISLQSLTIKQIGDILSKDVPIIKNCLLPIDLASELYNRLITVVLPDLYPAYPNINDLHVIFKNLFIVFIDPYIKKDDKMDIEVVLDEESILQSIGEMFSRINPYTSSLLRSSSPHLLSIIDIFKEDKTQGNYINYAYLSLTSRYLLLASYIASYIPDFDFVVYSTRASKKIKNKVKIHYDGPPKPFSINKLLKNFDHIVAGHFMREEEKLLKSKYVPRQGQSAQTLILQQISSLVDSGLIIQCSTSYNLHKMRYQANIKYEVASKIAKTLDFPLDDYH